MHAHNKNNRRKDHKTSNSTEGEDTASAFCYIINHHCLLVKVTRIGRGGGGYGADVSCRGMFFAGASCYSAVAAVEYCFFTKSSSRSFVLVPEEV